MSAKQDMSQTPFHLVLCLSRLSRHNVVAPTLAAPLLVDTLRSTVKPGTREDIVTKPDEMRVDVGFCFTAKSVIFRKYMTHFLFDPEMAAYCYLGRDTFTKEDERENTSPHQCKKNR